MSRNPRRALPVRLAVPAIALALAVAGSRVAEAAPFTATVQLQPQQAVATVGSPLAIDVYLRALTDVNAAAPTRLAALDLNFGGITGASTPLRFVGTAAVPLGFAPAAGFAATLPFAFDASLLNGYTAGFADLSYSVANGDFTGGIATNAGDVLVGTLYVTAMQPGAYTLSTAHAGTLLTANDDNGTVVTLAHLPAAFTVVAAPEPATLAAAAGLAAVAAVRRRRR